jgi:hypothetical protein
MTGKQTGAPRAEHGLGYSVTDIGGNFELSPLYAIFKMWPISK